MYVIHKLDELVDGFRWRSSIKSILLLHYSPDSKPHRHLMLYTEEVEQYKRRLSFTYKLPSMFIQMIYFRYTKTSKINATVKISLIFAFVIGLHLQGCTEV